MKKLKELYTSTKEEKYLSDTHVLFEFLLASIYLSCICGESMWQRSLLQMALHQAHFHLKKPPRNRFSLTDCEQQ